MAPQMGPKSPKGPFRNTLKFQCDFDCIQGLKMIPKWPPNQMSCFDGNCFFRGPPAHWSPNGSQRARSTLRGLPRNAFPPNKQKPQQTRIQNLQYEMVQSKQQIQQIRADFADSRGCGDDPPQASSISAALSEETATPACRDTGFKVPLLPPQSLAHSSAQDPLHRDFSHDSAT